MTPLNVPANPNLTAVQEHVLAAIAGGATLQAAAVAAAIHRNTISYWRRTSAAFRGALDYAQYDRALFIREEAGNQVADAFAALHAILTKPNASDSARLNAAKYIIEKASTPPPPQPEVIYRFQESKPEIVNSPPQIGFEPQKLAAPSAGPKPEIVNSPAQIGFEPQKPATPLAGPKPEIVNSPAQSQPIPTVRSAPKVGRNELCPCGSRLKFKRCCLGKSQSLGKAQVTMAA